MFVLMAEHERNIGSEHKGAYGLSARRAQAGPPGPRGRRIGHANCPDGNRDEPGMLPGFE